MRSLAIVSLSVFVLAFPAAAQERGVPRHLRARLVGCWTIDARETYEIVREGETGLRARWSVEGQRYASSMSYDAASAAVVAGCGARSIHGQVCGFTLRGGSVHVERVSLYSHTGTERTLARCAPGTHVHEPRPEPHPIPQDAPIAALLGARRRDVEAERAATGDEDGWTRYGDAIAIQYEAGVAMRVRARSSATTCEDAAREAGFTPREGSAPLHRADGCEWPGISPRHRLAPHVAARWSGGVMEIWRIE